MANHITSRENPKIKHILKLSSSSRARRQEGSFVCEGLRLCRDAVLNGVVFEEIYFTDDFFNKHHEDFKLMSDATKREFRVPDWVMEKISDTVNPQGILAICKIPSFSVEAAEKGLYIGLENIADPSNLGTIARSAEAFGAKGLLLAGNYCDPYSPKALRGGMGAQLRLPIYIFPDFCDGLAPFKSKGMKVYASVVDVNAQKITELQSSENSILLIGNEANGILKATAESADYRVTIPMKGRAESLNAAAAAAVLIWEFCK